MKKALFIIFISFVCLLSGCAAPTKASADLNLAAKNFIPPSDKASLYIFRNENFGGAIGMPVAINGQQIGETGAKTFFRLNLSPGLYAIDSQAENLSQIAISMVEGMNYFVWQEVRMGIWKARSALRRVDDEVGRAGVMESDLLAPLVSEELLSKTAMVRK